MNREKMIKTAKLCYTIVNVLQKILIVGLVLAAGGFILLTAAGDAVGMASETSVSLGNVVIELNEAAAPLGTIRVSQLQMILAAAILMIGVLFYGIGVLKKILDPMREGRPFDTDVADYIRRLGFVTLAGGLIAQGVQLLTSVVLAKNMDLLMSLFKEETVKHVTVNSSFSLDFVFAALILFLLSYVFRYGEELQKESDETL